jgi:hypothetical protein
MGRGKVTTQDIKKFLGIKGIRRISEHTKVVETETGGVYPATSIVLKMWELLTGEKI